MKIKTFATISCLLIVLSPAPFCLAQTINKQPATTPAVPSENQGFGTATIRRTPLTGIGQENGVMRRDLALGRTRGVDLDGNDR